jgi:hypothetical protein
MHNISTLPYYLELDPPMPSCEFFNDGQFNIDINTPVTDFVKKSVLDIEVLNPVFRDYLNNLVGAQMNKVIVWYWGNSDLKVAHIDCNSNKEVHPFAVNWVLNPQDSQVNFYDISQEEFALGFGDDGASGLKTENVTAYIPIDVSNSIPAASWTTKNLCLLNTSIPHMIETAEFRVSASIQFDIGVKFETTVERILNG